MPASTTNPAIQYPVATDTFQPHLDMQTMANNIVTAFNTWQAMPSGTGTLVGTYTGQPVKVIGSISSVATNASGDGGITMPAGINGILTAIVVGGGSASPFPTTGFVYKNASTTVSQIAVRMYNGGAAAASTTVAVVWLALIW